MSEAKPIPLVGIAIVDAVDASVLALHRHDHMQWQLPGGRQAVDDGEYPEAAAIRHAKEEVGLDISADMLRRLNANPAEFTQWGKKYSCIWFQAYVHSFAARLVDITVYDEMAGKQFFNHQISEPEFSANAVNFADSLVRRRIWLEL